jgi:hypothetical protein
MKRTLVKISKFVLCLGVLAASLFAAQAQAQVVIITPPAEFVATAVPVRHDGRLVYWYNGRWVYRHGRAWAAYRTEPAYLRAHRHRHVPVRHVYRRGHHRW